MVSSLAIIGTFIVSSANTMEGAFDRSAEIDKYVETLNTGTQGVVTLALRDIYWSGISDRRLADVLNEQLLRDFADISTPEHPVGRPRFTWTVDEHYGVALIEALASMGIVDYNGTFEKIGKDPKQGGAGNKRVRNEARSAPKVVALRAGLNQVMATRENHVEGGNPTTSMLINLLKSDDRIYRDFALDRIYREKLRDPRLLNFLESQVVAYVNLSPVAKPGWQEVYLRRNIRLLGLSGDTKYLGTMESVVASNVDEGTKKYARVAANLLRTLNVPE